MSTSMYVAKPDPQKKHRLIRILRLVNAGVTGGMLVMGGALAAHLLGLRIAGFDVARLGLKGLIFVGMGWLAASVLATRLVKRMSVQTGFIRYRSFRTRFDHGTSLGLFAALGWALWLGADLLAAHFGKPVTFATTPGLATLRAIGMQMLGASGIGAVVWLFLWSRDVASLTRWIQKHYP